MSETHPLPDSTGEANATVLEPTGYGVGSWRDGPVGSGVPVNAVMLHFNMRAPDIAAMLIAAPTLNAEVSFGIRIKSRGELDRLIAMLRRHGDDVWGVP
jgi:hypothetical protein